MVETRNQDQAQALATVQTGLKTAQDTISAVRTSEDDLIAYIQQGEDKLEEVLAKIKGFANQATQKSDEVHDDLVKKVDAAYVQISALLDESFAKVDLLISRAEEYVDFQIPSFGLMITEMVCRPMMSALQNQMDEFIAGNFTAAGLGDLDDQKTTDAASWDDAGDRDDYTTTGDYYTTDADGDEDAAATAPDSAEDSARGGAPRRLSWEERWAEIIAHKRAAAQQLEI